jgi:hypothetical protein
VIRRALTTSATTAALVLVPGAAFAATSGTETVTTAVGAGTLTITTGGPVDLGRAKLDPGNEVLVARGDLGSIRVTDTRTADLGFTVTGVLTPFAATGGHRISAAALGWDPEVLRTGDGFDVDAGRYVTPVPLRPERPPGAGLSVPRVLVSSKRGTGPGSALVTAALTLRAPASTRPGTYVATLTLTTL